jgi:uncharacterized protein (DUF58 family)
VLALAAIKEHSQVGLFCFSVHKETYVKPSKGSKQAYQIISSLYNLNPSSKKTDINKAIAFTLNTIRRRSVVIFISDFIDNDYLNNLRALAKKHDLVVIHIGDKRESELPKLGIVPVFDKESRKTSWVNTSSVFFRSNLLDNYNQNSESLKRFCHRNQANYLHIETQEDFVPRLIRLFKIRNKTRKSVR